MTEFSTELRRRREAREMTLTRLAKAINISKGHLSKIETGHRGITASIARRCDEVLEAHGELVELAIASAAKGAPATANGSGIPAPPMVFVGRERELSVVASTLSLANRAQRPCVISGLAGVGKTALALTAVRAVTTQFALRTLYVDMRGHTPGSDPVTPGEAAYRLMRQLDVQPEQIPAEADDRTIALRALLRASRALVLLDNVASAAQARPLLVESANCRFVVTSRNRLAALDEALHVGLGTLSRAAASELFRTLVDDGEASAVVDEIVERCGMLPLTVRVAAARCATGNWTPERYLERLSRESTVLPALNDGERDVTAALRVSFEELPAAHGQALALLACHPSGPITTEAAEALIGLGTARVDQVLDQLHDVNLVTRSFQGDVTMHDLVRDFALHEALPAVAEADREAARLRLAAHVMGLVAAADQLLDPHKFRPHVSLPPPVRLPFANADQALAWLRTSWATLADIVRSVEGQPPCWQLAILLRPFFFREKLFEPWTATHEAALRTARLLSDDNACGMVLNSLGMAHVERGALAEALDCHTAAETAYNSAGNSPGALDALSSAAWVRLYQGSPGDTVRDLGIALDGYRRSGRTRNEMIALRGLALASAALDDHDTALEFACEAHSLAQLPLDVVMCLNCLAWVCFRAGRLEEAGHLYRQAAHRAQLANTPYEHTRALVGLGNTAAHRGSPAEAVRLWREADESKLPVNPLVVGEGDARARLEPVIGTHGS
ncbi:helix-turn-helix domain-containing protein [Saccharothrix sp. NPDC042600]|uniref:helix-turn-helix domain-containing protein n=1 Tax=Saccharothrix TaxID=2071 RepID=UPI0033FD7FD8|nr:hypothetical protein GCM10017745_66920 [Saccharothrix mutabilis subsp. capreolus]